MLQLWRGFNTLPQSEPPAPCCKCAPPNRSTPCSQEGAFQAGVPGCLQRRRPQPGTALWRAPRGCSPRRHLPQELARRGRHRRQPGGVLHAAGCQDSAALQPACLAWPPRGGPPHTCLRSSVCTARPQAANAVCGSPGCTASEGTASPPRARPMRCTAAPCRKSKMHIVPSSPPDSTVWPSACSSQHSTGATCPARRLCAPCGILLVPQLSTSCMDSATVPWVTVGRWRVTCAVSWRQVPAGKPDRVQSRLSCWKGAMLDARMMSAHDALSRMNSVSCHGTMWYVVDSQPRLRLFRSPMCRTFKFSVQQLGSSCSSSARQSARCAHWRACQLLPSSGQLKHQPQHWQLMRPPLCEFLSC